VTPLDTALVASAVFFGAMTQRTTGFGFGLVASPFLVLVAGPQVGVSLSNALSALLCITVLARTWRQARWRSVVLLALPALLAVPPGALVVQVLPEGPLLVVVGALSITAVLVSVLGRRRVLLRGRGGAVAAGALSGFMNVTAGVGGPMASAYGIAQRWSREEFVPTMQAYLLLLNGASLASKGLPDLPWQVWAVGAVALAIGALAGEWTSARVPAGAGQRFIIAVAIAGGSAAVLRGVLAIASS
jgi:uncharacterized membrane protein YfcA